MPSCRPNSLNGMRKFSERIGTACPRKWQWKSSPTPGASEKITQDPTTQRRRARYPPPTPPQVACPVSKEAGRQAGRKLAGIFGGAGGVSPQRAASDSSRPGAGQRQATARHLPSIWNPARVSPAAARCDDDSARAVSRPPPTILPASRGR